MMKLITRIIGLILFSLMVLTSNAQFKVVGYLPNWGNFLTNANNLDYSKITHLYIAFVNPTNAAGDIGPTTDLAAVVQKAHDNNVKVVASLGGAFAPTSYNTLLTDAERAGFVTKIVNFVNTYNLDGIDVDLEGGLVTGNAVNYNKFVSDLADALQPNGKLVTGAVGRWYASSITNATMDKFDFVNIMAYDKTGPWAPNNPGPHATYQHAVDDLNYFINTKGVDPAKAILGVPFYGHYFGNASGSLNFSVISNYADAANVDQYVLPNGNTVYYNGIQTMKDKTVLAIEEGGGIMIWELMQDATGANSLLTAINDVVSTYFTNIKPTVSVTSPAASTTFDEGDPIEITADAADADGSISKVIFFAGTYKIGEDATAPYSINWTTAGAGTFDITARALDNQNGTTNSAAVNITVTAATVQQPFGGTAWTVPGQIEAENFDIAGYSDATAANTGGAYRTTAVDIEACSDVNGGYNVGWTANGEYLKYTINVTSDGLYDISVRVATTQSNKKFHIEIDGVDVTGQLSVPNTGGWQAWSYASIQDITLTAGQKDMKFVFDAGDFNVNFIKFSIANPIANPMVFGSSMVYPNPFQDNSTLKLELKKAGHTKVILYDVTGKEAGIVEDQFLTEGTHLIPVNASNLPAGFYICRIIQEDQTMSLGLTKE